MASYLQFSFHSLDNVADLLKDLAFDLTLAALGF